MIIDPLASSTDFNFPNGDGYGGNRVDLFAPILLNDITVVNADHVNDIRLSVCEVEKALVGTTPLSYDSTTIIQDGYNIVTALETLDFHLATVESIIGLTFTGLDGYASRIDAIEFGLNSHRVENSETDADGYSVHGVDGYVVGTANEQALTNKTVDSGTGHVGPKFIARSSLADVGNDQIQVMGSDSTSIVASINWRGDAYFAGDITVEGDRVIKGTDVVQQSLVVDGYTILGNNATIDTHKLNGDTTIDGNLSVSKELTVSGSNITLGDSTGTLDLNFIAVDISKDATIHEDLVVEGSTTLGDASGDTHTIKGNILHSLGNIHTSGEFRALGTSFSVEGTTTTINTTNFQINSTASVFGNTTLFNNGNVNSDGYQYEFGELSTTSTNTFVVNATAQIEDMVVVEDISITNGGITASNGPNLLNDLEVTGSLQIRDGSEGTARYVWTSTDTIGNGEWAPAIRTPWVSIVVDGYSVTDAYGTTPLVPLGFYTASAGEEIYANADAYGSFTVNLPSNPIIGDRVRFVDFNGQWGSPNSIFVFPEDAGVVRNFAPGDINTTTDRITITLHGLITGQRAVLTSSGTLPGGLGAFTYVYVYAPNVNEIELMATLEDALAEGPAINITSTGTGTHTLTTGTIQGSGFLELDVPNDWAECMFNGTTWRVTTS